MSGAPLPGSCLCGTVCWTSEGPFQLMTHCHCSMCRKAHGAAFATYVGGPSAGFHWSAGEDAVQRFESSPGNPRAFCGRCGSVVPGGVEGGGQSFVPAGCLDADPGVRPVGHIYFASRPGWAEVADELRRFDTVPADFPVPEVPAVDRGEPEPGAVRGSCLCGGVRYRLEAPPALARHCHCGRCRKARAAAHATNLLLAAEGVRFTRGEELLRSYKVPEARFFTVAFCATCGGGLPRVDRERGIAVVPMGALDDDPGIRPGSHIFVGSRAPWFEIRDGLPQHAEGPE